MAPAPQAAAGWSDEKIKAAAERTRDICSAGIRKQMKWQPSCKKGSAKWAYEGSVAHPDVFYTAFALEKPEGKKKAWKLKTLTVSELENFTGPIEASIRYGSLQLTGGTVRVNWNADDLTYKLAGSYGL
ncbi:hypothetical protein I350_07390 [Cryptococcus amylolentus CBS 6273]|nr:hypothetical protein I350_07390 [Cryptococcus amylolentus CBS 6273]